MVISLLVLVNGISDPVNQVCSLSEDVKEVYIDDIKRVLDAVLHTSLAGITVNSDEDLEIVDLDKR